MSDAMWDMEYANRFEYQEKIENYCKKYSLNMPEIPENMFWQDIEKIYLNLINKEVEL